MSITISRLVLDDGSIFEEVEVAPDHLNILHIDGQRRLEFVVTRKVVRVRNVPHPFGGGSTEVDESYWAVLPGAKFERAFDPAVTPDPYAVAYDAILADARFAVEEA